MDAKGTAWTLPRRYYIGYEAKGLARREIGRFVDDVDLDEGEF
jgi:hypothetical protein